MQYGLLNGDYKNIFKINKKQVNPPNDTAVLSECSVFDIAPSPLFKACMELKALVCMASLTCDVFSNLAPPFAALHQERSAIPAGRDKSQHGIQTKDS